MFYFYFLFFCSGEGFSTALVRRVYILILYLRGNTFSFLTTELVICGLVLYNFYYAELYFFVSDLLFFLNMRKVCFLCKNKLILVLSFLAIQKHWLWDSSLAPYRRKTKPEMNKPKRIRAYLKRHENSMQTSIESNVVNRILCSMLRKDSWEGQKCRELSRQATKVGGWKL